MNSQSAESAVFETIWPIPELGLQRVEVEQAAPLKEAARLAVCRQQLVLTNNQQSLVVDWPTSSAGQWQPRSRQNPAGELILSLAYLANGLCIVLCSNQLLWLDRKWKVVRRHAHSAENPIWMSVSHDGWEIAVYSGVQQKIYIYRVPPEPQSMVGSWFSFQKLQPNELLIGGEQFFCHHPNRDLLVYSGRRGARECGLWIRQGEQSEWLGLGQQSISTSRCGGHRPCSFSHDGAWLLISSGDGLYLLSTDWNRLFYYPPQMPTGNAGNVAFSSQPNPDGSLLASVSEPGAINFFRVDQKGLSQCGECPGQLFSGQFIPSTQELVACLWDGQLCKFRLTSGMFGTELSSSPSIAPAGQVEPLMHELQESSQARSQWPVQRCLEWSPPSVHQEWMNSDSAEFISSTENTLIQQVCKSAGVIALSNGINRVICYQPETGQPSELLIDCVSDRLSFEQIALSPSGTRLATGRRFQVKVWDCQSDPSITKRSISKWVGSSSHYYKDAMFALRFVDEQRLLALTSEGLQDYWNLEADYPSYASCEDSPNGVKAGALSDGWVVCYDGRELALFQIAANSPVTNERFESACQLTEVNRWSCEAPEDLAVSSSGAVAWIREGIVYLQERDRQLSNLVLPCGRELGQVYFKSATEIIAHRQGRTVLWDWSSDQTTQIQSRGRLLNVLDGELIWRSPDGVEFCARDGSEKKARPETWSELGEI